MERAVVSVLIATRNRAASLDQTLESLAHQRVGPDFPWQVIVANNGSQDTTSAVLAKWRAALPLEVLDCPAPGKYRAVNQALGMIRSDLALFTDDDVLAAPDWAVEHVQAARRWPDRKVFGGPVQALFPPGTPEWVKEKTFAGPVFSELLPDLPEGPADQPPFGNNLLIRAEVFATERFREDLGPQSGSYPIGGETEFLVRLQRRGWEPIFVPRARVQHVVRPEQIAPDYLLVRGFNYGRGLAAQGSYESGAPRIGGVPRYLWRQLLAAQLAAWKAAFGGDLPTRTRTKFDRETIRGIIFELRKGV